MQIPAFKEVHFRDFCLTINMKSLDQITAISEENKKFLAELLAGRGMAVRSRPSTTSKEVAGISLKGNLTKDKAYQLHEFMQSICDKLEASDKGAFSCCRVDVSDLKKPIDQFKPGLRPNPAVRHF